MELSLAEHLLKDAEDVLHSMVDLAFLDSAPPFSEFHCMKMTSLMTCSKRLEDVVVAASMEVHWLWCLFDHHSSAEDENEMMSMRNLLSFQFERRVHPDLQQM